MNLHFNLPSILFVFILQNLTATSLAAQENLKKIGYINSADLINQLPERKKADSALNDLQQALKITGEDYEKEFREKLEKFNADSLKMNSIVKESERKKLQDLYNRLNAFGEDSELTFQNKQQELWLPLQKKVIDAVKAVAKENGYIYVFEAEIFFVAPEAVNLMPLVKKNLGLR